MTEPQYTSKQVEGLLDISVSTLIRRRQEGVIIGVQEGRRWVYSASEVAKLAKWMADR